MKSWVAYDGRYLWEIRPTEKEAKEVAARLSNASVKGFEYGEGDKVTTRLGEEVTIDRPAMSVTGGIGYKVTGGRWEFYFEEDIMGLAAPA